MIKHVKHTQLTLVTKHIMKHMYLPLVTKNIRNTQVLLVTKYETHISTSRD